MFKGRFNLSIQIRFYTCKIMPAARKRKVASADEAAPAAEGASEEKTVTKHESGDVKKLTIEACKSWYVADLLTFSDIRTSSYLVEKHHISYDIAFLQFDSLILQRRV